MSEWHDPSRQPGDRLTYREPTAQAAPEGRWQGLENWLQRFESNEPWPVLEADLRALEAEVTQLTWERDELLKQRVDARAEVENLQRQLHNDYLLYDVYLATMKRAEIAEAEVAHLKKELSGTERDDAS